MSDRGKQLVVIGFREFVRTVYHACVFHVSAAKNEKEERKKKEWGKEGREGQFKFRMKIVDATCAPNEQKNDE